jgi:TolB-like protein/Tfp pilus assembly protein PilF
VVGITVLAGVIFAGLRSLVRRRGEPAQQTAPIAAVTDPAPATESPAADLDPLTVPGFEGRPAIAVLPFDNLSGDPDQEYFADGIAEDLITRLSGWRSVPVIARNSSFTYKGKPVDVKQVSRELGVRYVVEGSVRRVDDRVRIAAQLIDATTGGHVWAQHYDRDLDDILALQDEITEAIVASMSPELVRFEERRAAKKEIRNLDAWDCTMRGLWHLGRFNREDHATARSLFEQATALDPHFSLALALLAVTHQQEAYFQWTDFPTRSFAESARIAQESVNLDPENPLALLVLGWTSLVTGDRQKMIDALERSIQIDPSQAVTHGVLGMALAWAGRSDEAIENAKKAMRLSPHDPMMHFFFLVRGIAHFAAEEYEEAADWAQRSIERRAVEPGAHRYLAASHVYLGRMDEARRVMQEMYQLDPDFSLAVDRIVLSTAEPAFVERLHNGLRKAGLKE